MPKNSKNKKKKKLTKKENIFRLHLIEIVSQKFHSLNNKKKIHKKIKYYPRFYIQNILHIFHKHIYEYQDFMDSVVKREKKNIIKMSGG